MRVEFLSDHGSLRLLRHTQGTLRTAEANLEAWRGAYGHARAELAAARGAKPLWKRLFLVPTPRERRAIDRLRGTQRGLRRADDGTRRVRLGAWRQAAGLWGSHALEWSLSALSDEWVALRGYRNARGTADHVIIGPLGVWVVEAKRWGVRLNAVGDTWWYEKVDSRENVVTTGWAVDGSGRSWARQVNEVGADLAGALARHGHPVPVHTAVMLTHERAQLGRCEDLPVTLLGTHPEHLRSGIAAQASRIAPQEREEILTLVRRDHLYHSNRERSRARARLERAS